MRNEQQTTAIRITNMLPTKKFTIYELEIQTHDQLIIYQTRYSELYALFGKVHHSGSYFPSKQNLFSFFRPLLPQKTRNQWENTRYQGMKQFFHMISQNDVLSGLSEFQQLKIRAKLWQENATKKKRTVGKKWPCLLEQATMNVSQPHCYVILIQWIIDQPQLKYRRKNKLKTSKQLPINVNKSVPLMVSSSVNKPRKSSDEIGNNTER